jgi:hypothetical protein
LSNIVNPLQKSVDAGLTSGAFDGMFKKKQEPSFLGVGAAGAITDFINNSK